MSQNSAIKPGYCPATYLDPKRIGEILLRGPEGDAGVVRRAAAQHLGPGVAHEAVALLLGLDQVVPVIARIEQVHPILQAQDRLIVDVRRPRFQHADGDRMILRQPRRQYTAGGAAARDHVVEFAGFDHGAISPRGTRSSVGTSARCSASTSGGFRVWTRK